MHGKMRGLLVGLAVAPLLISGCSSGFNEKSASEESMETVGNPMQPLNAEQADETTPPVRGGEPARSWYELNEQHGDDEDYVQCVEQRLDIDWPTKVPSLIEQEKKPDNGFTIIVALNVDRDPQWVRDFARENESTAGVTDDTPVVYTSKIDNTMTDGCAPFNDHERSTVTVVDVVPNAISEGNPSLDDAKPIKGFMNRCKNPVIIPPGSLKPSPSPSGSDSASPSASSSPSPSGSSSPPGTPGTPTPSTPPPSLETKIPGQNPGVGNGTGNNEGLGDKTVTTQPGNAPREDPKEPEADTPKAPKITSTPRPSGSATPTVDPGGQDNHGEADPDNCAIC